MAKQAGIGRATLLRWVQKYKQSGSISALVKEENPRNKDKFRLPEQVEAIVKTLIESRYLNKQKLSVAKISSEVAVECRATGLETPHYNTIRRRIGQISEEQKLAKRQHHSIARNKYKPIDGQFPGADYPFFCLFRL